MKNPDLTSQFTKVWQHDLPAIRRKHPEAPQDATIASFIINAPWANPIWANYWLTLIHTRPLDPPRKTLIYLPGATHEFWLYALDPKWEIDLDQMPPPFLAPINFAAQFIADSDQAAEIRIGNCIGEILVGTLSPDTDFRQQWIERFNACMMKGHLQNQ